MVWKTSLFQLIKHMHNRYNTILLIKKISYDQELIQSDPISCPQNKKGNNQIHKVTAVYGHAR